MHRFYVPALAEVGSPIRLLDEAARQCSRVLRLEAGERVALFDGSGAEAIVVLTKLDHGAVTGLVDSLGAPDRESRSSVELWMGLPRQERWEWVIQKGTELGLSAFQPLDTARCVARLHPSDTPRKEARWNKIIVEAAEQSGRTALPRLAPLIPIREAPAATRGIVLHTAVSTGLRAVIAGMPPSADETPLRVLVGPEGGLEAVEVESLVRRGWRPASLGVRTLRCETAAVTACVLALDQLGELGSR